jgi:hypothetical protein
MYREPVASDASPKTQDGPGVTQPVERQPDRAKDRNYTVAMSQLPGYMTTAEIAAHWGFTRARVSQLAKARGIEPALTVGNVKLWRVQDLMDFKPRATGAAGHAKNTREGGKP